MKEVNPILPMNISSIITHLPKVDNSGVNPRESPVVPNAEQTSKRITIRDAFSEIDKAMTATRHIPIANIVTTNDFIISSS